MRTSSLRGSRPSERWLFAGITAHSRNPGCCRKRYTNELDDTEISREIQCARYPVVPTVPRQRSPVFLMMAFNRMPSPQLEADTLDALRAVMRRAMQKGDHGQELQETLARAAAEARTKEIYAE